MKSNIIRQVEAVKKLKKTDLWSEYSRYPRCDWRIEAWYGDTQLGYWDWVEHKIAENEGSTS